MEQQNPKRDNSGYLFKNANKRSEKQPDFRGKLTFQGKEWLVSGWNRNKDGEEMISISLTDPATLPARDGASPAGARPASGSGPFAKPAASATPAKSFQPSGQSSGGGKSSISDDEMSDLDSLFNGMDE